MSPEMTKQKSRRSVWIVLLVVIAAAAAVYFAVGRTPQRQQAGGRFGGGDAPVPVLAVAAKLADVPIYIDGVGTTKALNTVTVRSQVDGKLIKVSFQEGQDVPAGYVLAEIDPTLYQAQYDQAVAKKAQDEAILANARIDLDRYTRLAQTNAGPKQQADTQKALVQQNEAQVKLDQASIDNVAAMLSYTKVRAPLAGRTGIRQVDEGNIIHATDTTGIVVLTQLRPISVFFSLPQQQLGRVNAAFAKSSLSVEALGPDNKTVVDTGKLIVVDNQVDQTTGTVKLKAEFPNPDLQLWPGQFINVRLLVDTLKQVVVVPTAAVQRGPNGTFVYTIKPDNTVATRNITVSEQDDVQSVVTSGLEPPERVVTTGFARLTEDSAVSIASSDETQPVPNAAPPRRQLEAAPRRTAQAGAAKVARAAKRRAASRRGRPNERVDAIHPATDRDLAARRRGDARRRVRLLAVADFVAAAGRLPDDPGDDAASRRQSRHHRVARDRSARAPVRPDPGAADDDLVELLRHQRRSRCNSISTATSMAPRRTYRPRSMRPLRRCRATCPIRRSIRRSIRPTRRSSRWRSPRRRFRCAISATSPTP